MLCPTFARYASQNISAWLQYKHSRFCSFGLQQNERAVRAFRRPVGALRSERRLAHKMLESRREAARMLSILPRFAAARVSAHKYRTSARRTSAQERPEWQNTNSNTFGS